MIAPLFGLLLAVSGVDEAERAYRSGRYEEALGHFQAALSEPGAPEGPLLYNQGNCLYRLNRHAEALLCWRRAQLRLPRDRELRFNLRLAEERLGVEASSGESFRDQVVELSESFTPRELLLLVAALETTGLVGFLLLRRRRAARGVMAFLLLLALLGAARLIQLQWFAGPPAGVVLASEIALRPEPHPGVNAVLRLKAGETVRVEEQSDRWVRVAHPRGEGWTERGGIGVVD